MQRPEKCLVVFFGMVATGKSYLASAWAGERGIPYYNSDRVRKSLAGVAAEQTQQEGMEQGIYGPEFTRRTYDCLFQYAWSHLQEQDSFCVVLDGSYQSVAERHRLRSACAGRVRLLMVHCVCSEAVVKKRLQIRSSDPHAVSDGNWEIYCSQKRRFQGFSPEEEVLEIDTDAPLCELMALMTRRFEAQAASASGGNNALQHPPATELL